MYRNAVYSVWIIALGPCPKEISRMGRLSKMGSGVYGIWCIYMVQMVYNMVYMVA